MKVLLNWENMKHIHFMCCVSCKANYLEFFLKAEDFLLL